MTVSAAEPPRLTQADRRARTRNSLLEATARGLSRYGYGNLVLERVATEAGYSRGALYHLFANKEDLALAVVDWVEQTWFDEVGRHLDDVSHPVEALLAVARGHAIYCRRDIAGVMMTLRAEFGGRDHPIGVAVDQTTSRVVAACTRVIAEGRQTGAIPPGPPPGTVALAFVGAIEGIVIHLDGKVPHDVAFAEMAVRGVLGLAVEQDPASGS